MRAAAIVLSIISLTLGFWLTAKHLRNADSAVGRMGSGVAPVVVASEDDAALVTEDAPTAVASDKQAANGDRRIEVAGSAMRNPYYEPEFRDALVDYLVEMGLSALDSERTVDAAIDRLTECAATFSSFDTEGRTSVRICDQNALQETGLNEAIRQIALNKATRHLARRLALERSAKE